MAYIVIRCSYKQCIVKNFVMYNYRISEVYTNNYIVAIIKDKLNLTLEQQCLRVELHN